MRKAVLFIILLTVCILALILLNGCNPQLKATRYFLEHKDKLAPLCATEYPSQPIDTTITYSTDSSGYEEAITSLVFLVDSLLNNRDTVLIDGTEVVVIKTNVDSLRSAIVKEIKKKVQPCKGIDSSHVKKMIKSYNDALASYGYQNADCSLKLAAEHEKYIKAETERGVYKGQAKSRMWIMILAFFLLGVSGYFNIKKLFI